MALSLGRVQGDLLQCRYHGWRFDRGGAVVDVPCHAPSEKLPACAVRAFAAVERDGWIWVTLGADGAPPEPPSYPRDPAYGWFELQNMIHAPVDLILENGLDCSHTGFAHEGLFRSAPKDNIRARVEETATGVRVETLDECSAGAKDVRSVLGRSQPMRHIDEVITYVNAKDRPLGLYFFTNDKQLEQTILYRTISGGVTINNCVFHVAQHDMPFGGVGASGMGQYHGHEGFVEFSKMRPVFTNPKLSGMKLFYPPYTKFHTRLFDLLLKLKH